MLTSGTKGQMTDYMANLYRSGKYTDKEIVQKTGAKFGLDQSDYLPSYNVLRMAKRIDDAGQGMNQSPMNQLGSNGTPSRYGDPGKVGMYQYTVLIEITDPLTGRKSKLNDVIYFVNSQSESQLSEYVDTHRSRYYNRAKTPKMGRGQIDTADIGVTVLTAGIII